MTTIEHKRQQVWSAKLELSKLKGCESSPQYMTAEQELVRAEKALPQPATACDDDDGDDTSTCGCGNADDNEEDE